MTRITDLKTFDLRFPTSQHLDGSDAMNPDPDYSAAYVVLTTDNPDLTGHGLTFTIGRGNDICAAIEAMRHLVVGLDLEWVKDNPGRFWRHLTGDSQLRWIGPDKGVIHLATGAVVNAVWDLWAKEAGKPIWELVADMSPEELVRVIDFRYLTIARRFADRIAFAHLRNVAKDPDGSFMEADHLGADTNMVALVTVLLEEQKRRKDAGDGRWRIPMRPDHGHELLDDVGRGSFPGYSAIGRMRGLAELRGVMQAVSALRNLPL